MLIERLQQVVQRRIVTANCIAAVVVLAYLLLIGPSPHRRGVSWPELIVLAVGAFTASLALIILVAVRLSRRIVARNTRWLAEDREPTADERRLVLAGPLTFAVYPLPFWLAAAIVTSLVVPGGGGTRVAEFVVIVFGGILTSALTFPLIEQVARAHDARPGRRGAGGPAVHELATAFAAELGAGFRYPTSGRRAHATPARARSECADRGSYRRPCRRGNRSRVRGHARYRHDNR